MDGLKMVVFKRKTQKEKKEKKSKSIHIDHTPTINYVVYRN